MYEVLRPALSDPILQLAQDFREDQRAHKIDLGIGVYKDARGAVPLMHAVRSAQAQLILQDSTKIYVGIAGHEPFNAAIARLVLGESFDAERVRAIQTPGGQGAVRLLTELVRVAAPGATVWISDPSWANHFAVVDAVGLARRSYRYYDAASAAVNFAAMMADLRDARRGDVVVLHASCHNPTGADLSIEQWREVANLIFERGLVPFADVAYQGLGAGIEADVAGVRILAERVPELLIAVSCSKSFAVYRDRVGCALLVGDARVELNVACAQAMALARVNYSMPPHHGAAVVSAVLECEDLRTLWECELAEMRASMAESRRRLAAALRLRTGSLRFDFIERHSGMFSLLGVTSQQVKALRTSFGIFLLDNSRINVAGLQDEQIERIAHALQEVLRLS